MTSNIEITNCRSCTHDNLIPIISLGDQYVVNFVDSNEEGVKCPLDLVLCDNCKLLQLKHSAPPESMWGDQYWYRSAINKMIREDLNDIVSKSTKLIKLEKDDLVIDIGANDGTLLENYNSCEGVIPVGFEPSGNVAKVAVSKGYQIINDFFNADSFSKLYPSKKAKIITAISMFYDLEDPNEFLEDINKILDDDGMLVIQQNYLVTMLKNNAFDNICHEHREYYSLISFNHLLERHGLEVFDIEENNINGGSIRTYIKKKGSSLKGFEGSTTRLVETLANEKNLALDSEKPYKEFASRISSIKLKLLELLNSIKQEGKTICALGASTRGNVLLQYFGLGPDVVDCIFDKNPDKEGKKTVGGGIPITSPVNIDKYSPDYQLVLIWHIFKGLGSDETDFLNKGGKFILPLPDLKVIDSL
jgi:hypothetical protein